MTSKGLARNSVIVTAMLVTGVACDVGSEGTQRGTTTTSHALAATTPIGPVDVDTSPALAMYLVVASPGEGLHVRVAGLGSAVGGRTLVRILNPDEELVYLRYVDALDPAYPPASSTALVDDDVVLGGAGVYQVRVTRSAPVRVTVDAPANTGYGISMQNGAVHQWAGQPGTLHLRLPVHRTREIRLKLFGAGLVPVPAAYVLKDAGGLTIDPNSQSVSFLS